MYKFLYLVRVLAISGAFLVAVGYLGHKAREPLLPCGGSIPKCAGVSQ